MIRKKRTKRMTKKKKILTVKFADIKYSDEIYNPEGITNCKTYTYIIDGDGKEKLMIEEYEEIDEEDENGE